MSRHLRPIAAAALTGFGLLLTSTPASAQPDPNLPALPGTGGWVTCQCESGPATALIPPQAPAAPTAPAFPSMVPSAAGEDENGEDETETPGTGEPGTGEPGTGEPGTGEPGTEAPETEVPGAITVGDVETGDITTGPIVTVTVE
ncbi:hypothetical protein GCM10010466_24970 [Planomonospora alba]|uniref:Uncharacterized protein n=1 Tax=Planomonospora alba TaxID=161354 RepID=A0ABP6N358_9ACTN